MALMVLLGAALVAGVVAIARWGNLEVEAPWEPEPWPMRPGEVLKRYVWYVTVALTSGVAAGIVMLGGGGRLVMRLLAVTAGPEAQGVITEADQVVGEITLDGTIGFILFFGVAVGTALGFIYMAARRWLPRGRWGGIVFGVLVLLVVATRSDPLRPDNPDFDLVGPDWVAVLAFSAIVIAYGMLLAAIAGRYSRILPPLKKKVKTIAIYLPGYVLWGPAALVLAVPVIGLGAFCVLVTRTAGPDRLLAAERTVTIGRALLVVVAVAVAPGFVLGVADILGSG